jgi:ribosomal protein L11 methyltransferase
LEIGKELLIKPSWSKKRPRKNQAIVILDPGLSFGTGQHPTTSFCLAELVRRSKNGTRQSFLDIGTGSGILAIAAAKLGYQPVLAFDFDPESVRIARQNARINRVAGRLKLTRGDITKQPLKPARQYDLVCANLISNLLISEKRRIVNRLEPHGILVLAGILAVEFAEVEWEFADLKMKLLAKREENEWCSGSFCFV